MHLTPRSVRVGILALLLLACGSKSVSNYPDAQTLDAGASDAVIPNDRPDGAKPPPLPGADNVLLFSGTAHLLSNGQPCTTPTTASADRWCGFTTSSSIRFNDLYVVNVSKVAAGTAIRCGDNSGDSNCLRLTRGFFEEDSAPVIHGAGFQGESLVYFDITGTPYGWRPGMANGRVLALSSVGDVHDCLAATSGTAVACLEDIPTPAGSTTGITMSNLLLGRMDDAVTDPPLQQVDTVISNNNADSPQRFQYGFPTPDGDFFAWSSRPSAMAAAVLKVQKVGDPTTLRTVATDVFSWGNSPDGTRWYWLSQYGPSASGSSSGTLQSAPFPDGANPVTLLSNVVDFQVTTMGSMVVLTTARVLQGIVDPIGAPSSATEVDTGVIGFLRASPQGQVVYAKKYDFLLDLVDLYVKNLDGSGSRCTLTSEANATRFTTFTPGSAAILWSRANLSAPVGELPNGLFTSLADCKTSTVASQIALLEPSGDNKVLFIDEISQTDGSLKVQDVIGGNMLGSRAPVLIQSRVDGYFPIGSSPHAVLFTVNAGSTIDGLYLHAIPSDGASPDGGAAD